jgi:hypothetical protein
MAIFQREQLGQAITSGVDENIDRVEAALLRIENTQRFAA